MKSSKMKKIAREKAASEMDVPCLYTRLRKHGNIYSTACNLAVLRPNILNLYSERHNNSSAVWITEDAKFCAHSDAFLHFIYMGDKLCEQ